MRCGRKVDGVWLWRRRCSTCVGAVPRYKGDRGQAQPARECRVLALHGAFLALLGPRPVAVDTQPGESDRIGRRRNQCVGVAAVIPSGAGRQRHLERPTHATRQCGCTPSSTKACRTLRGPRGRVSVDSLRTTAGTRHNTPSAGTSCDPLGRRGAARRPANSPERSLRNAVASQHDGLAHLQAFRTWWGSCRRCEGRVGGRPGKGRCDEGRGSALKN